MDWVEVGTQGELDEAVAAGKGVIVRKGSFTASDSSQVRAYDSSQVRAYGSSQVRAYDSSQVTASGSSQVTASDSSQVTAYDSSQVRASGSSQVTAYDSSQVRAYDSSQVTASDSSQVTAYGSSQVRASGSSQVTAYGSSQVTAYDSSQVRAYPYVAVTDHGPRTKINGGVLIVPPRPATAEEWCQFHGVQITGRKHRTAVLFKALNDDFTSPHGLVYEPGSTPKAPDWDTGKRECGGGLHFSPSPGHGLTFNPDATRFVACPVLLEDIRPPRPTDDYPDKVKARRVFRPIYEVDIQGNRI